MKIMDIINWNTGVLVKESEYNEFVEIMSKEKQWNWDRGEKLSEYNEYGNTGETELVHFIGTAKYDNVDKEDRVAIFYSTLNELNSNEDNYITLEEFKEKLKFN